MQASQFYAAIRGGRKVRDREKSLFFAELCDVNVIPVMEKLDYYQNLRRFFIERACPELATKSKALPAEDARTFDIVNAAISAAAPYVKGGPNGR